MDILSKIVKKIIKKNHFLHYKSIDIYNIKYIKTLCVNYMTLQSDCLILDQ